MEDARLNVTIRPWRDAGDWQTVADIFNEENAADGLEWFATADEFATVPRPNFDPARDLFIAERDGRAAGLGARFVGRPRRRPDARDRGRRPPAPTAAAASGRRCSAVRRSTWRWRRATSSRTCHDASQGWAADSQPGGLALFQARGVRGHPLRVRDAQAGPRGRARRAGARTASSCAALGPRRPRTSSGPSTRRSVTIPATANGPTRTSRRRWSSRTTTRRCGSWPGTAIRSRARSRTGSTPRRTRGSGSRGHGCIGCRCAGRGGSAGSRAPCSSSRSGSSTNAGSARPPSAWTRTTPRARSALYESVGFERHRSARMFARDAPR